MKVTYQNQNNCTTLSKRPKSGDKDKYQTIINTKIQAKNKYASYFQSPNKVEDLLFIKKKFQKMKKNSKDKLKNKTTTNNNNSNTNTNISSSYISFMSPINKNYNNKKQNFALTKFLKNKLILNSIESTSLVTSKERSIPYNNNTNNCENLSDILKCSITKNNKLVNKENNVSNNINPLKVNHNNNIILNKDVISNSNIVISKIVNSDFSSNIKCTPESSHHTRIDSNYSLNLNLNKQAIKDMNKNKKNRSSITSINSKNKENKEKIKEKSSTKDKDNSNFKVNRKSCRFNYFNNINNENLNQNKLYSYKGMINAKKNNKNNYSNSNQNLLSNTVFEYNKSQHGNNINFFENYVKAVAMNKNNINKYTYNKSISINKSSNFNNISNKKNNHNITYNSNNVSNTNTNREINTNSINGNKNLFPGSIIHSPKCNNVSKTTKSSPKSSLINLNSTLNKMNKKAKGHIKNKSISIITKSETSLLFKGNNLNNNINGAISNHNHKYKINYNNMNYSTTHSKANSNNTNGNNLYSNYGNQYKCSINKKLNLIDIGNNNKKTASSPYNVYYKKKTQPNSNENTIIHNNKNKMNLSKNNNINTTGNNSKNKNIHINKNHLPSNKNLSSLNNSTQYYYNNLGQNKDTEVSSPTNNNSHQYQKTENIIVNNYNININNQIQNNSFYSNHIISVDSKKGNKNKNNNNMIINQSNNIILPKQNFKKKKIFSQSLKDILISNNKNAKNFTTNNSPINKLEILLNTNNNNIKNNNEINSDNKLDTNSNKFTYKKWSSNRDKIRKDIQKKKVFESISSRKKEENKINNKIKMDNNNIINSQRKYIDLKKRITEEIENDTKTKKNSIKNEYNKEKQKNIENKINENNMNNRNTELSFSKYNPTLSSRSSTSYDSNYYMKESLKLSCYISKYFNKYKKYPDTSLQFYKYGRLIGQGAFGKVNLGLNILTGRIVAVKSFNKKNSELTGDNMKKIKYETDLMKKLNHPNITKILEMFEDEKFFLIIMEYINGGNLFSFVKKRRKLSEKTAKFLFRQIILGIKYIHEQNIVHRDIKLENLLIDLNNNVKICDFGIGRKIENKKQLLHDQCGTLMYMAPEILLSSKEKGYEGFPVDIWSAGISLYIMLSGTLPFNYKNKKKHKNNAEEEDDGEEEEESISSSKSKSKKNDEDNFELQYNIVYKEPKHIEKISDEARDLLKGLLNKDPKKRLTCEQILNHPWLYNFKEENNSSNKFHLFTKAEMIMLSKTFIDYRRANYDDLKENFTLSNLENENDKNNLNEQNITNKSSILAPYNSIISDYENSSSPSIIKNNDNYDSFDDFNNSKIKLEKDEQIVFSKKVKEYNRLYELNNNGEVDNGVLINSKTQSSINMSERNSNSRIENKIKDLDMNLNEGSCVIINENNNILNVKESKRKIEDINVKNDREKNVNEEMEHKIKSNNILSQMSIMGYDKKYVLDCVEKNELCHASTVYYLMMNYENI